MFHPAPDETRATRRRFGLTEALLIAAILAFGGFTLVSDGRLSMGSLIAGVDETLSR